MHLSPSTASGRKTADAAIMAAPGRLMGLILENDGTNACSVILYDNATAASGTVLAKMAFSASAVGVLTAPACIPVDGVVCQNGIYADVTGTGAAYEVYYVQE